MKFSKTILLFGAGKVEINIEDDTARKALIADASIVISMMPPTMHYLIAVDCIAYQKNQLTASYTDERIKDLSKQIENKGLHYLCEMGLDPGIDHMSAMKLIHEIESNNGKIVSFKSHCGGLVVPENDDNPWHYKISWNPRNSNETLAILNVGPLAFYPNRDSISYLKLYDLKNIQTFIRTTHRYPAFIRGWHKMIEWLLICLGLNDSTILLPMPSGTAADIFQFVIENKLALAPSEKDMVAMLHEIDYTVENQMHHVNSSLVTIGNNKQQTAMAKTVGLPLGIAAVLIFKGTIKEKGLHIPVKPAIYAPILKELEKESIQFTETHF